MAHREDQAVSIARSALAQLEAIEWPAYSEREGDAIALSEKALRDIVKVLTQGSPEQSEKL